MGDNDAKAQSMFTYDNGQCRYWASVKTNGTVYANVEPTSVDCREVQIYFEILSSKTAPSSVCVHNYIESGRGENARCVPRQM